MMATHLVTSPVGTHFNLSKADFLSMDEDQENMKDVSYASVIGNLMYAMTSTVQILYTPFSTVSRYMASQEVIGQLSSGS